MIRNYYLKTKRVTIYCNLLQIIIAHYRTTLFFFTIISEKNAKRDRDSKNQPEQLWPFPMYSGLQLQLKDPSVLVQVAFSLQLWELLTHSSASEW